MIIQKLTIMKKFFMSACAAFAMFAFVACGSGNPAIDAAEKFLSDPTEENMKAADEAEKNLTEEQKKEFEEWTKENAERIVGAALKAAIGD